MTRPQKAWSLPFLHIFAFYWCAGLAMAAVVAESNAESTTDGSQSNTAPVGVVTSAPIGSSASPGVAVGIAIAVLIGTGALASIVVYIVLRRRRLMRTAGEVSVVDSIDPSRGSGIRRLDEVGSINPLAKKKDTKRMPSRIRTELASQIYQGHRNSWTPVSPVTSIRYEKKSMEATASAAMRPSDM